MTDSPLSITARIKEAKGNEPFHFFGPDDETAFQLPGRAGLGGLDEAQWLTFNFPAAVRRIMGNEEYAKLKALKPSKAWVDALCEAYEEHLGAQGKSSGSSAP